MAESTETSERLKAKRNVILTAGVAALGGLLFGGVGPRAPTPPAPAPGAGG